MKLYISIILFSTLFYSCGEGGDSPAANAKKVCKCYSKYDSPRHREYDEYDEYGDNYEVSAKCDRLLEKYEAKYAKSERRLNKFYDALDKCEGAMGDGGDFGYFELTPCECMENAMLDLNDRDNDLMERCEDWIENLEEDERDEVMEELTDCM